MDPGHVPWIHSQEPTITYNTLGSYNGSSGTPFLKRAALHNGEWTISFVLKSSQLGLYRERHFIVDGSRSWGNMESVVGIGRGHWCGNQNNGNTCDGGTKEIDRGSCSAETLWGDDWQQCSAFSFSTVCHLLHRLSLVVRHSFGFFSFLFVSFRFA